MNIIDHSILWVLDVWFILVLGTEQEWKLAQSSVEAASNGLYTATNELCMASVKAKSASGCVTLLYPIFMTTSLGMHLYVMQDCIHANMNIRYHS